MDLLVRRGGFDSTVERRHTLVYFTNPAFQVADEAKRIAAQQRRNAHGFTLLPTVI